MVYFSSKNEDALREQAIGIRDYLSDFGPKTARELSSELFLGLASVYAILRFGSVNGIVKRVAHIHNGRGTPQTVWDSALRIREVKGRLCTCMPLYDARTRKEKRKIPSSLPGDHTYDPNFLPWFMGE